ncbi:ACP S-malonyltransferase [Trichothermofontia sichuanensis B231]|uniref:ACP S-malonyltransferase n=1 Tax=Trichothermofontia sichuanensis TaxID=3045816 RepID=UPI002247AC8A|nr:ACP S-malonyltransferase [Trichothermofontia sichuanensis]UZQ54754.1 ACP S-malonyltransferase [Trichothermofontia sichuanensis B231]
MKTAWVFPGQGSQTVGMGGDLQTEPLAQKRFQQAEAILGWSVLDRCQGDETELARTLYTQPCLYVIECILVDLLRDRGHQPDLVAGHSLGEYVALYSAGVFDFATGLRLIQKRAALMDSSANGAMAALIGADRDQLEQVLANTADVVLANDNSAAQVVISGTPTAVETVLGQVKAKRAVRLNVSGAFHSPLIADAAAEFAQVLEPIAFQPAQVPVLSNVEPQATTDAAVLKQRLAAQMTGQVRWREICLQLPELGIEQAWEVGPGNVLTGLLKRTCKGLGLVNIGQLADLPS